MDYKTVWEFRTLNFRVALEVCPEEDDPAGHFDDPEDVEAIRYGSVEWFVAHVAVYGPDGEELAFDSLGGCAYTTVREFYTSHRDPDPMNRNCSLMRAVRGGNVSICHYFPGMVRGAVQEARTAFADRKARFSRIHFRGEG